MLPNQARDQLRYIPKNALYAKEKGQRSGLVWHPPKLTGAIRF